MAKKVKILNAEEALKETGMTREEWNNMIANNIKQIQADDSLSEEEKNMKIVSLLMRSITKNNKFLLEELLGD